MSDILLAAPRVAPPELPAVGVDRTRMRITWEGWNGETFELSNWRSGAFLTQGGTEGLGTPVREDWTSALSPFVHGQEYQGFVVNARELFLPVYLYSDEGSDAWRLQDAAFWETLLPGKYGTLSVTTSGGTRTIRARYADGGEAAVERDPHYFGWQKYGIKLIADDPFWYGDDVTQTWREPVPRNWLTGMPGDSGEPTSTGGSVMYIMPANTLSTATVTNPGDVEAWPSWEVPGPFTALSVGVGDRQVSYNVPVLAGQVFRIDTDPRDQTAFVDGDDVTGALGSYGFAPIPAGQSVPLNLSMAGVSNVTARFSPRYYRAWGK